MVLEGVDITWSELVALIIAIPSAITIPITAWLVKLRGRVDNNEHELEKQALQLEKFKVQVETQKMQFDTQIQKIDLAVTAIRENILESREVHKELREDMKEIKSFTIDWNQRLEDRIQNIVNQLLSKNSINPPN